MFESCITFYGSYNVQIIFALQQKSVILSKQKRTQSDPKHSFQYDKMNTIFNNFNHICIKSDKSTVKTNISHKTRLCHVGFPAIYLRIKSQIFEVQSDNVFQSTLKLKITYFVLKIRYFISKKKTTTTNNHCQNYLINVQVQKHNQLLTGSPRFNTTLL